MRASTAALTREWLQVAEADLRAATELGSRGLGEVALYHCQQAAEKALKGYLAFQEQPLMKTHNVTALVAEAQQLDPAFASAVSAADRLTPYATRFRYPPAGAPPTESEVRQAVDDARAVYDLVLSLLPETVHP